MRRAAISPDDVISALLEDLPEEAFPGQDDARVLLEMVVGTVMPATAAAGEETCRLTMALAVAIRERVPADLRAAARIAEEDRS
jgi:hypothetical protein